MLVVYCIIIGVFVSVGSVYMVLKHKKHSEAFVLFSVTDICIHLVIMYHNIWFEEFSKSHRNLEQNMVQVCISL